jgi:hypothetical protein
MGIVRMVDYTRGSHNVYKERYSDPALWQKEFDSDIRFWLKFNADWYESVILSKDHMTIDMKSEDHVWFEDRWMVASLCDE